VAGQSTEDQNNEIHPVNGILDTNRRNLLVMSRRQVMNSSLFHVWLMQRLLVSCGFQSAWALN
jgi:hypothetical protein